MLSRKTKYALRAALYLAHEAKRGSILIAEISEKEKIPMKFLELILLELKHEGILVSKKGRGGGYSLARAPESITVGDVIRAIQGTLALVPCLVETNPEKCEDCLDEAICGIKPVMRRVYAQTSAIVDRTTLAEAVVHIEPVRRRAEENLDYLL